MILHAATGNKGKLAEFINAAKTVGIDVLALPNLGSIPEPVEDADTFQGNADIKARAYSLAAPGLLVFADDSGIAIPTLNNAPGVRSARFADDAGYDLHSGSKTDKRNNDLLLHRMQPHSDRAAQFLCTLALAQDGEILLRAEGSVEGQLLHAPRGDAGFGYDPLFLLPELGRTMAELTTDEKWAISHRGNAFRSLLAKLPDAAL